LPHSKFELYLLTDTKTDNKQQTTDNKKCRIQMHPVVSSEL